MAKGGNQEPQVIFLQFADSAVPVFKELRNKEYIEYGEKNGYPEYLLSLYNKSGKHNAIINGKVNYIYGKGFENGNIKVNRNNETLNDIAFKAVKDKEIFGGFKLEIIWGLNGKISEIYHCDYTTLRKAKSGGFWFKESWDRKYCNDEAVFIPEFDPANPVGSQIYEVNDYRPGIRHYPLPSYIGCINYVETDIEIGKFYLSSIKNGMMPSKMIQFYEGANVADEKKGQIERRWKDKFTGSENAGKFILVFNTSKDKQVTVDDLSGSDLDKHFQELNKTTQQEIFAGHNITSPMLFGIKTEGQLGGNTELKTAYSIFQNTYSIPKGKELSTGINYLMAFSNNPGEYELQATDPIGVNIDISTVLDKLPLEYVLEKVGVPKDMWLNAPAGAVVPAQQAATNDTIKNLTGRQHQAVMRIVRQYEAGKIKRDAAIAMLKKGYAFDDDDVLAFLGDPAPVQMSFSDDEVIAVFDQFGESKEDYEILRTNKHLFSSQDDELIFKEGFLKYDISTTEDRIMELIKKDPLIPVDVIATAIKETVAYVKNKISILVKKGYLEEIEEAGIGESVVIKRTIPKGIDVTAPPSKISPTQIYVKYSYEGPEDSRNRPFCAKLMSLKRLYSRAEIEKISERLGYSVFDRRGGFWRKKDGTISESCRHDFKPNIVIKKGGTNV